jgi:hypothetical protein
MSDLQEGLGIILAARKSDEPFITVRLQAAIDVMSVEPYYEHLKLLRAIFHVPEPTPEEGGESDGA